MSSIRRGTVVIGALALLVVLAACSSSKHAPSSSGTESHLEKKATEAATALLAGKYDAGYTYLDATCQKRWTKQTWAANATAGVAGLKTLGIDLSQDHVGSVTVTNFTPTSATVTTHILDKSGHDAASDSATTVKSEVWVHQDGRWVNSDCPAAPSGSAPSGSAPSGSAPSGSAPSGSAPSGSAPSGSAPSGSSGDTGGLVPATSSTTG